MVSALPSQIFYMPTTTTYVSDSIQVTAEETDDVNRPIVAVHHDGVELKSRIGEKLRSSDVNAQWLSPDELSGRSVYAAHIPYFAMKYPYYRDDRIQPKAIIGIASAMIHDFKIYEIFKRSGPSLVARFRELLAEEISKLESSEWISDDDFRRVRSALRFRMRAGEITSIVFQRSLQVPTKLNQKYYTALSEAEGILMEEIRQQEDESITRHDMRILRAHALGGQDGDDLRNLFIQK